MNSLRDFLMVDERGREIGEFFGYHDACEDAVYDDAREKIGYLTIV